MERRQRQSSGGARAGESMIMVVVMLMVFFVLGASVLTAASATTAAASARVAERQSYYYGRALLDVLDESLQTDTGGLNRAFRSAALNKLAASEASVVAFDGSEPLMTLMPSFSGAPLTDITFDSAKPLTITCEGRVTAVTGVGETLTAASVQMRKVDVAFTLYYKGIPTYMRVQYRCTLNVTGYNARTGEGTWSNTWKIQQVG